MKHIKIKLLILLLCLFATSYGQDFPWKKYGLNPKVMTLSNGKYKEFHDMETVVQIGSVYLNTKTHKIVGFVKKDTTSKVMNMDAHTVSRWMSPDPLSEEYSSWSPYNYVMNNPVIFIDPDGRSVGLINGSLIKANPIYDEKGEFMGTDDKGLQGDAIIMNRNKFKQGMSHEDALSLNLGEDGLKNDKAKSKFKSHFKGLKYRPDYDGYLTLKEANEWYKNGNGQPLFTKLSMLDLFSLCSLGDKYIGSVKSFNILLCSTTLNDGLVYGHITFKRYPNDKIRAYADEYNFEMHNSKNPLNWPRNLETLIGRIVAGQGQKYKINLYGSKVLTTFFRSKK